MSTPNPSDAILRETWLADVTVDAWASYDDRLTDDGYIAASPERAASIDRPIAELAVCPRCHKTMYYRARLRSKPRSYRAFAVCVGCDVASEF